MRIGSYPQPNLDQIPVEAQIEVELMSKELDQQKLDGAMSVKLIDSATAGINMPLSEGPVGRLINIRI